MKSINEATFCKYSGSRTFMKELMMIRVLKKMKLRIDLSFDHKSLFENISFLFSHHKEEEFWGLDVSESVETVWSSKKRQVTQHTNPAVPCSNKNLGLAFWQLKFNKAESLSMQAVYTGAYLVTSM